MAAPTTPDEFVDLVRKSGVLDEKRLDAYLEKQRSQSGLPTEVGKYAGVLVRDGMLTHFQAEQFLLGKWRRFTIGKYKVLERIGSGGMGSVYLCEHKFMRRRVAVKVLPTAKAEESSALERFYREARAVAALDHPNIVRAYDIDQEDKLHFLVMEYIDGASLQEIVKRHGPLSVLRACHYIRQAAAGLHHAHQIAGLVHRDIKPGNILVDRLGIVKVLDMGLARFFHDEEEVITKKYDENVLGTADYLAPEQALDSHSVDIRADIYSLGATFYFCLTGNTPFNEGTVAQKLIWHQTRQPKPVQSLRPEVPDGVAAIVDKMMAKEPEQRFQNPDAIMEALAPWTTEAIPPPPAKEMPQLSLAASGTSNVGEASMASAPPSASPSSAARRWAAARANPTTPPPSATPAPGRGKETPPTQSKQSSSVIIAPSAPTVLSRAKAPAVPLATPEPFPAENSNLSFAPETADVTAHLDTAPHSVLKRRPAPETAPAFLWKKRAVLLTGVGIGGILLAALLWWAFFRDSSAKHHASAPANAGGKTLTVTRSGQPNSFKTIREALTKARAGDRVVVLEDQIEETLLLEDGRLGQGVTIEAGNAAKQVLWSCPPNPTGQKFLSLSKVQGLRLQGFILDGQNRVPDLLTVQGACPGLTLDSVQLRGFTHFGLAFWNCAGNAPSEGVTLKNVRIIAEKDAEAALAFNARESVNPPFNRHVLVTDCRLEGPCKALVRLASPVLDVEFRRNRFFNSSDGFLYLKNTPRHQIQLTLDSNTFYQEKVALRFQSMPLTSNHSRVVVKNNLFGKTATLAQVDDKQRLGEIGLIFQLGNNVRDPGTREGNLSLGTASVAFTLPTKPEDDATFLRYSKTDSLARAGLDPVGVPPAE